MTRNEVKQIAPDVAGEVCSAGLQATFTMHKLRLHHPRELALWRVGTQTGECVAAVGSGTLRWQLGAAT